MNDRRAAIAACALVCALALGCPAHAADPAPAPSGSAEPVPIQHFFAPAAMSRPVLSPDGRRLAIRTAMPNGRIGLAVIALDPPRQGKGLVSYADADVGQVHWVNDQRLLYNTTDSTSETSDQRAPGLYAIDADGDNARQLVQRHWQQNSTASRIASRVLLPNHALLRTLRDGSHDVVILRHNYDNQWRDLIDTTPLRLDTMTGLTRSTVAPGYPDGAREWLVDDRGHARLVVTLNKGQAQVHWRADGEAPWTALPPFDAYRGGPGGFEPVALVPDGEVYATAVRRDAERTSALYRFDRNAQRLEAEPLVGITGFDFDGALVFDRTRKKLLGVHYRGDAANTHWIDEGMKQLQARIDERLPGTINLLQVAECGCSRWVVVTAYADRQPEAYLLYDRDSGHIETMGLSRPAVDPRRMATRDFTHLRARDGLSLPVHVTKPDPGRHGKGPWPAVVLVHGGPQVRGGSWEWRADSQFLASRGYLVVEPEFRGSQGYGQRLFRAGWKQWGLAMQDDVADATKWAIGQGLADPKRICIAGASYGGYATLMGLVRDGELYRCGVAWVAVTDIQMMFDVHWSDLSDDWKGYGMPVLIGDPEKDAAQFEATSPLKQAARITQPLLLAFGGADRRVPIVHGTRFRDAVAKTNHQVEWIEYPGEGHGWMKPENRYDFWGRVEAFLGKHLAAQAPAGTAKAP